jgi:hypothetical protein
MGLESKVYIVERKEFPERDNRPAWVSAIVIAEFDLCKMGWGNQEFFKAFKREIDFTIYLPTCDKDGNETVSAVNKDCYGEHMKSAELSVLISALETIEARDHYRRLPPLISMLKAFNSDEWDGELQAVLYNY